MIMEMKVCKICGIEKEMSEYHKQARSKDGYNRTCKKCRSTNEKQYYEDNKEKHNEVARKYRKEHLEKIKERARKYYHNNKERDKERRKKYVEEHKEEHNERGKVWVLNNPNKVKEKRKRYHEKHKEEINERKRNFRKENYEEYRNHTNDYIKNKRRIDPLFRLKGNLHASISAIVKRSINRKKTKTLEVLGCDYEIAKQHLESQFEPWMNWENYGKYNGEFNYGWDIDHIIPQSIGNTEEELIKLNHYTNLQPLCSKINRVIKKDKRDYYESLCNTIQNI